MRHRSGFLNAATQRGMLPSHSISGDYAEPPARPQGPSAQVLWPVLHSFSKGVNDLPGGRSFAMARPELGAVNAAVAGLVQPVTGGTGPPWCPSKVVYALYAPVARCGTSSSYAQNTQALKCQRSTFEQVLVP